MKFVFHFNDNGVFPVVKDNIVFSLAFFGGPCQVIHLCIFNAKK